jgi:hypothetical protein
VPHGAELANRLAGERAAVVAAAQRAAQAAEERAHPKKKTKVRRATSTPRTTGAQPAAGTVTPTTTAPNG